MSKSGNTPRSAEEIEARAVRAVTRAHKLLERFPEPAPRPPDDGTPAELCTIPSCAPRAEAPFHSLACHALAALFAYVEELEEALGPERLEEILQR